MLTKYQYCAVAGLLLCAHVSSIPTPCEGIQWSNSYKQVSLDRLMESIIVNTTNGSNFHYIYDMVSNGAELLDTNKIYRSVMAHMKQHGECIYFLTILLYF